MRIKKADLGVGDYLVQTYGCTMHRASYYQVERIEGSRVYLCAPLTEFTATGYDAGHLKLAGAGTDQTIVKHGKFTTGGLKECFPPGSKDWQGRDTSWKAKDHHWDYFRPAKVGDSEYTYGD